MRCTSTTLEISGKTLQLTIFESKTLLQLHIENLSTLRRICTTLTPEKVEKLTKNAGAQRSYEQFAGLLRKCIEANSSVSDEIALKMIGKTLEIRISSSYENLNYQIQLDEVERNLNDYYYIMYRNSVQKCEELRNQISRLQIDKVVQECGRCKKLESQNRKLKRVVKKLKAEKSEIGDRSSIESSDRRGRNGSDKMASSSSIFQSRSKNSEDDELDELWQRALKNSK